MRCTRSTITIGARTLKRFSKFRTKTFLLRRALPSRLPYRVPRLLRRASLWRCQSTRDLPFAAVRTFAGHPPRAAAARASCHPRQRGCIRAASESQAAPYHACTAQMQDSHRSRLCARHAVQCGAARLTGCLQSARGGLVSRLARTRGTRASADGVDAAVTTRASSDITQCRPAE